MSNEETAAKLAKAWLESEEGRKYLGPMIDKRVTDGIKTYVAGHAPADAEAAAAKIAELEAEVKAERLAAHTFRKCVELNVPVTLLDGFASDDPEAIDAKVVQLSQHIAERTVTEANRAMSAGFKPGSGNASGNPVDLRGVPEAELQWAEATGRLNRMIAAQRKT